LTPVPRLSFALRVAPSGFGLKIRAMRIRISTQQSDAKGRRLTNAWSGRDVKWEARHGRVALCLPFRDFSFVLKIQCEERGTTGVRETVLLNEKLKSGEVHLDGRAIAGWMKDPYDVMRTSGLARNLADDNEFDQHFQNHPLSRARRFLDAAEANISVSDTIRSAPPSIYGTRASRNRSWWKLW
jgi:hypothetical protein